jgi:hypothetical protein
VNVSYLLKWGSDNVNYGMKGYVEIMFGWVCDDGRKCMLRVCSLSIK